MSTHRRHLFPSSLLTLAVLVTTAICGTLIAAASAPAAAPQVAMGDTFTMLIKPDGSLFAWGSNLYGQLGLGSSVYTRTRPSRVGTANDWAHVATGAEHTLALKDDGSLWAWGNNLDGRLGLGDTALRSDPTRVGVGSDWTAIAAGLRSSFALKSDGTLWAWGVGAYGRLGLGDTDHRLVPTQVGIETDWAMVDGGGQHTVAVKSDGTLWAWGRNNMGQLGQPWVAPGILAPDSLTPEQVGSGTDWKTVSCSSDDNRAMKTDGTLWAWGYNSYGQLGQGDQVTRPEPTVVGGLWSLLACGDDSNLATKADGTLWAWGDNSYGQLGQGDRVFRTSPTKVGTYSDWSAVVSGNDHVGALRPGGLWVWGKNGSGQLGLGDKVDRLSPELAFDANDVTAPTIDLLTSPTHPNSAAWTADAFPTFEWVVSGDAAMYSKDFDKTPGGDPIPVADWTLLSWTAPQTADGTWYFHVRAADVAGNWSTTATLSIKIDATAPLTTDDAPAIGSKTPVTVHLTATDAYSGVKTTEYKLDDGAWTSGTQVAVAGEGLHTIAYRSTDKVLPVGNVEADKSCTVRIDATAPLTTDDAPATWSKTPVTLHLVAADAGVGVAATEYKLDAGAWMSGTQVAVAGDGLHTIAYRSTDALGNVEAIKSCTVRIDATAPLTTDDAPSTWSKTPVTVRLAATDAYSGVAATEYKLDAGAWTSGTQVAVSGEGLHTLAYRSTDAAGNVEAVKDRTVRIDTRRPTTRAPKSARVRKGKTVALTYRVADPRPGSPTATVTIAIKTLSGKTVRRVTLRDRKVDILLAYKFRCTLARRTYRFFVYATDAAGNVQARVASNRLTVY